MALGIPASCDCGTVMRACVPKDLAFSHITGQSVDWRRLDACESARGELEAVRHLAALLGQRFVELDEVGDARCPSCGQTVSILAPLHRFMQVVPTLQALHRDRASPV